MSRIAFTDRDPNNPYDEGTLAWFDPAKSQAYNDGRLWNGHNLIGACSGSQWIDQTLYRTRAGRWVLHTDATRYYNGVHSYRYLSSDEARAWLLRTGDHEDEIERIFGETPEESPGRGRPEIGPAISVKVPLDALAAIDAAAESAGVSRAEWIRRACSAALA